MLATQSLDDGLKLRLSAFAFMALDSPCIIILNQSLGEQGRGLTCGKLLHVLEFPSDGS